MASSTSRGARGEPIMKARIPGLAAGLALAVAATAPAQAQFMTGPYPVIIVPPPPAQNLVVPQAPRPAQQPKPAGSAAARQRRPGDQCSLPGQTRVCE